MQDKTKHFLAFLESLHGADPVLVEAATQGYLAIHEPVSTDKAEQMKSALLDDKLFKSLLSTVRGTYEEPGVTEVDKQNADDRRRETLSKLEQYLNLLITKKFGVEDPDALRALWLWVVSGLRSSLESRGY